MTVASCHCGAVKVTVPEAPAEVTACNCSICRRYGTLWAYYSPREVSVTPASGGTDIYMWDDKAIEFHRCKTCGCVTHWWPVDPAVERMGVNARLMEPIVLAEATVIPFDGASM